MLCDIVGEDERPDATHKGVAESSSRLNKIEANKVVNIHVALKSKCIHFTNID